MGNIERCWVWQRLDDGKIGVALEQGTADAVRRGSLMAFFEEMVPASHLEGAVKAARADMAEHLRKLSLDPSWKYEVRVAFEYAVRMFDDPDSGGQ